MSSSYVGSHALGAPFSAATVPGFDVLQPASYFPGATTSSSSTTSSSASSSSSTSSSSASADSYEKTYDDFETSINSELMDTLGQASSALTTASSSDSAFAQLQQTLDAIAPGVANGLYGGGSGGVDTLA